MPLRATAELLGKEVGWDQKTNTASINDKDIAEPVAPTPAAGYNEYIFKNESGKALFSLKINRVYATDDRNKYSDKNPVQVIMIDYTYTNIADPEEIYIFSSNFKAIDNKGKIGYVYPADTTYSPQKLPVGVTCDAQMAFGLDNKSESVKIIFYENMFRDATTTFNMSIE